MIVDGVSGMLVAPGDSASLAKALKKMLLDRAHAARIGAAGRETVRLRAAPARAAAPGGDLRAPRRPADRRTVTVRQSGSEKSGA